MKRYSLASTTWDEAEYAAINKVVASGMFTMGAHVAEFERQFAARFGAKYCVMVNSGSSANLLMVAALFYRKQSPLQRGDEIIMPAVSWSTTYYPAYQYGLKIKFVDIDRDTLNYDLEQLATAIGSNTRAVMAVNLLGNPNDFSRIHEIIGGRDIVLLEDNCESMGATFEGKQAGTFGLMGSYSSFFSHHISTMEGGMIITGDEELYHILLSLRAHGWTRNLPKSNRICEKSDDDFEESFRFVLPGYNVRPLEMSGAIGLEQLKKIPGLVKARRDNAAKFQALMTKFPHLRIQKETGHSSWFGFSLVVNPGAPYTRKQVIDRMREGGVEVRPIVAGNFVKNDVVKWLGPVEYGELKNADDIDKNGFFIGNHHYALDDEFGILAEVLCSLEN